MSTRPCLSTRRLIRRLAVLGILAAAAGCGYDRPVAPVVGPGSWSLHLEAISPTELEGIVATAVTTAPAVVVKNQTGSPVSGIEVSFSLDDRGSAGSIATSRVLTDARGVASVGEWTLGLRSGWHILTVTVSEARSGLEFRALALPDVPVAVQMFAEQVGFTNDTIWLRARVRDRFGNGVEGVTVRLEVTVGDGTVENRESISSTGGHVAMGRWILGPQPGRNSVTATAVDVEKAVLSIEALGHDQVDWYDLAGIDEDLPGFRYIESAFLALSDSGLFVEQIIGAPGTDWEGRLRLSGTYHSSELLLTLRYFDNPFDATLLGRDAMWLTSEWLQLNRVDPLTSRCCAVWRYKKRSKGP